MEKFHKNIDFFAFEANSTMSCQITLFAKIFFQEKAKEKVISRIFCTFLRIIEHFGSSNTIEKARISVYVLLNIEKMPHCPQHP